MLELVEDKLYLREVHCKDIYDNNHAWPITLPETREIIFGEILDDDKDTVSVLKKYNTRYNKIKK